MIKKLTIPFLVVMLIGSSLGFAPKTEKTKIIPHELAPINKDAVVEKLVSDGILTTNASYEEIDAAIKDYVGNVKVVKEETKYSKKKDAIINQKIAEGITKKKGNINGNKIGNSETLDPITSIPYSSSVKTVKVLALLVNFPDLSNNKIERTSDRSYWTSNFDQKHFEDLLFGEDGCVTEEGIESPSLKSYFKQQSSGALNIEGGVFGWYTANNEAAYYGATTATDNDSDPRALVVEALEDAVEDGVNLSDYDKEDPYDIDDDEDLLESDGIVDHLMIIHSGMGEEEGGGVLGENAIWSHSWNLNVPTEISNSGMYAYDYTMMPENGAVAVFAHEFTHDLGMPDDYDTVYSADGDTVEYWSLMASGSWAGNIGGTKPVGINPYHRILLGLIHGGTWINWNKVDVDGSEGSKSFQLGTSSLNTDLTQAILFNLPEQVIRVNTPKEGTKEFFGGNDSEIDNSMDLKVDLTNAASAQLSYDLWYDIEEEWDAGFIQVSEDGENFTSLSTPYTKTFDNPDGYPTIIDSLPAYTGSSDGWISENIDLSDYAGKNITVRFRYATDWASQLNGMYVDNVKVNIDGEDKIVETAENEFGSFVNDGWEINDGNKTASHFYVGEWRSHLGVDEGLKECARAQVEYNQGLLLWYINGLYEDNWVGVHPGYGQCGVVDATQHVYLNAGLGNGNESGIRTGYMPFVQLHDAAFSVDKAADMDLSAYSWAKTTNLKARQAEPVFDDSNSYLNLKSPYSGLFIPNYGLNIRVNGRALDYSTGSITIN